MIYWGTIAAALGLGGWAALGMYRPRLADNRVGYFVTALKDFSQNVDEDRFVRYINRWQLEKADPSAPISPRPAATSTTSMSISMPATRASRRRMRISCSGTCRRPTRRA